MTHLGTRNDRTLATTQIDPENEGFLSVNASDAKAVDITAYQALYTNSFTNPKQSTIDIMSFLDSTEVIDTSTGLVTFLYEDVNGTKTQKTTLQEGEFIRDNIALGVIIHELDGDILSASSITQVSPVSSQMGFADLSTAMAPINTATGGRNIISGNSGTLEIKKSEGGYYNHAFNAKNSGGNKNPNFITSPEITAPVLSLGWRSSGTSGGVKFLTQTEMLTLYDDGTAVNSDALPQGVLGTYEWTNHRIHEAANVAAIGGEPFFIVQLGQKKYSSKLAALIGLQIEEAETFEQFKAAPAVATLTIRGGSTDLTDIDDCSFTQAIAPRSVHR